MYNDLLFIFLAAFKDLAIRTGQKEEFEDAKCQHNDQKKNNKRTNTDLQNIHIKLKIEYTRTPLKTGGELS